MIQCDCDVTRDVKITSIRDIDRAFEEFVTRGFGGTDFRPVFKYVDELVRTRELANLKGLIYFTDGLGKYPVTPPAYETAFVFVDDTPRERKVPALGNEGDHGRRRRIRAVRKAQQRYRQLGALRAATRGAGRPFRKEFPV